MREDWVEVELGRVCETTSGGTPSRRNKNYFLGNIPWVKSGELRYNIIFDTEEHISEEAVKKSSAKVFPQGTLLIALYGATIGKLAILGVPATTNQAVCGIFENGLFQTKFLFNYLFHIKQKLIEQGMGGAQPNISQTILKKLSLPIAPLPEQRAIVAKIEQLFSELDNGITNLKAAKAKLEIYRQAVLKKAFGGELTKTKKMNFKPVSDFVYLVTKGASPKWQGFNYLDDKDELLFITSENVRDGFLDFSKEKYLPLEFNEKQKRSTLQKGDVLFNLVGASIGRAAIFNLDNRANINQAVAVIRLKSEVSNVYLNYFLNSEIAKQEYLRKKVDVARANLSLKDVNDIVLPYCSLEEQQKIVYAIETRLSVCDNILCNIEEGLEKAEALRQSILKKAFEGKLLNETELAACRQQPDWEPAEKLLARIQQHRRDAMHGVSTTSTTMATKTATTTTEKNDR